MDSSELDWLIDAPPYSLTQGEKEPILLSIAQEQLAEMVGSSPHLRSFYKKLGILPSGLSSLEQIPLIPAQMFKRFDLRTCAAEEVVHVLSSSGTTGGGASRIPIDAKTASRQERALAHTLKHFLGTKRKPFLVLDSQVASGTSRDLSARGAGIRGLARFSNEIAYALTGPAGEELFDRNAFDSFCARHAGKDAYAFGFTYIIWSVFLKSLAQEPVNLPKFNSITVFHSGGWKKLSQEASPDEFTRAIAAAMGTAPANVRNFYGMAEEPGVIFVDCENGCKHVPNFADIIIRDPASHAPLALGVEGLIEVLSVLPTSYPGQAILTEDIGRIKGIDDCACGRKGKYFTFRSRISRAQARGCGDTFTPPQVKNK